MVGVPLSSGEGQAEGQGEVNAAPSLAQAIRTLAQALHDRVELQQLQNATTGRPRGFGEDPGALPLPGLGAADRLTAGSLLSARLDDGQLLAPPPPAGPATPGTTLPPLALSIPLATTAGFTTLDLRVRQEGGSRFTGEGETTAAIRASFSVTLDRLGEVGADLRLAGPTLRCRLSAAAPSVLAALSAATGGLRTRLEAAGFHVESLDCRPPDTAPPSAAPAALRHVDLGA